MRCGLYCGVMVVAGAAHADALLISGLKSIAPRHAQLGPRRDANVEGVRTRRNFTRASASSVQDSLKGDGVSRHRVVLLRHGESTWNRDERYIGWTVLPNGVSGYADVPLTAKGEDEARAAGRALQRDGFEFDMVFCSLLKRVLKTQHLVMNELDQLWVPQRKDWRLNERHYGDLIGKTKEEAEELYGAENVALWASSYDTAPEPMSYDGKYYPRHERRYQHLVDADGMSTIPTTECMKDVSRRVVEVWEEEIAPVVRSGKRVMVVGHANMLKALLQHLDGISNDVVMGMSIPRATPMVYDLAVDMKSVRAPDPTTRISADLIAIDGVEPQLLRADAREVNAF